MTIHQVDRADFEREPMADDQEPRRAICPHCDGSTIKPSMPDESIPCPLCEGYGWVSPKFAAIYNRDPERALKACANVDKQLQRAVMGD